MEKDIVIDVLKWVLNNVDEYVDATGDIDLTQLEEEAMIEFDLTDEQFDEYDLSFLIYEMVNSLDAEAYLDNL